jgi:hypothetical protein
MGCFGRGVGVGGLICVSLPQRDFTVFTGRSVVSPTEVSTDSAKSKSKYFYERCCSKYGYFSGHCSVFSF